MGQLEELQKIELDILIEIDRICKKHNIKYFLSDGTLLGAIRHKGFIPWDDDIDIEMKYDEYKRFVNIAINELKEDYFLQTYMTDKINMRFAKVRKNNTTVIEQGCLNKPFHQGAWVDIFPIVDIFDEHGEKYIDMAEIIMTYKNSTSSFLSMNWKKKFSTLFQDQSQNQLSIICIQRF